MDRREVHFFTNAVKFRPQSSWLKSVEERDYDTMPMHIKKSHSIARTVTSSKRISHNNSTKHRSETSVRKTVCSPKNRRQPDLEIKSDLLDISVGLLKSRNINNCLYDSIGKDLQDLKESTNKRDAKIILAEKLHKKHGFFKKIHPVIVKSMTMVGKIAEYSPESLIFDDYLDNEARSKNDIGFLLYGKLELKNDQLHYSRISKNTETLFQHKYIRTDESYIYYAQTITPCAIMWLSRENYYILRKEYFLTMDLKYMFHEFQNLLKFFLVHKKVKKIKEQWRFFEGGHIRRQMINQQ